MFYDELPVEDADVVGEVGRGFYHLIDGLNPERITGAATANGIGRYALDKAAGHVKDRVVWNGPIGAHQGVAHPLAKAKIHLELARLATWHAAAVYDAGEDAGEAANMAKYEGQLTAGSRAPRWRLEFENECASSNARTRTSPELRSSE